MTHPNRTNVVPVRHPVKRYRAFVYGLRADYPMVAPNYAETRRQLVKKIGLGRMGKGGKSAAKPAGRRGRPSKA